ncbi:hypothetical protein O3M35_001996 [Rhynocoris fuscipes]|uniref:Rhythmically expressed gene 2 protein n=1 Tax=Rhynocoris fuscipes TaxID=488301 RepID=A0AAW1CQW1_9HEMI
MYRLITFDVKDTLLKTRYPIGIMYTEAGKLFGINRIKSELIDENFKKEWKKMCLIHPNFGLNGIGWENWWQRIVKSTFLNSTNEKINDVSLNKLSLHLLDLFSKADAWKFNDGTIELLDTLKSNKIVLGTISNFDIRLHRIIKEFGIDKYFSFILTSYETNFYKPDVNIFKLAERKYEEKTGNKLNGIDALHVGNSIEHDINGARNAGWSAAYISEKWNLHKFESKEHILSFKNLNELKQYLILKQQISN